MVGAADLQRRSSGFSVTGALRPSPHRFPQSLCPLHLPSHRGWTTAASASSSPSGGLSVLPSLFASPCAASYSKYAGLQEKKERVDTNPSSTQAQVGRVRPSV